jgi:hypothetical protein
MTEGQGANPPPQDEGPGRTIRMDGGAEGGAPLPKTVKMTPPDATQGKPRARWWLTSPRTTYLELPKKQQRSVLMMLVLGIVLMVVTVVLLKVLA